MNNHFSNGGKKISWVQLSFLLCIIVLTVCIFITLSDAGTLLSTSAHTIGIPLLAVGAVTMIIAAVKKSTLKGRMWLSADGAATAVLSVVLILSGFKQAGALPFYFGVWEIAIGIFKLAESRRLKREKVSGEGFLYIGIAEIISGTALLFRPVDRLIGYNIAVVITLAIQMSAYALRYYLYPAMAEE